MNSAEWEMVPFHTLFRRIPKRTGHGDKELLSVYRDYGVIIKSERDDNFNRPGASLDDYQLVKPGDLVLNKMKTWQGSLGVSAFEGIVSPAYFVYEPLRQFDRRFMHHLLRAKNSIDYYAAHSKGIRVNQWDLQPEYLDKMKVYFPPLETQQRIAEYLKWETAEIDAAVADLDRYLALMEKRKLSRIESALKSITYRMCPVGLLADVTLGKMISTAPPESGGVERPYLRAAHVQPGGKLDFTATEKKMWFSEKEFERLDLLAGDVVVVEGGAGFGRSAYLETDLKGWGFQNSINRVRVDPSKADGRFVHLMLSRALLNGSIAISVDTATLPHFTAEKLARFRIPICEVRKQRELSQEIHEDMLAAKSLIAESTRLRELLLKRRQVLITEIVTGRKKV